MNVEGVQHYKAWKEYYREESKRDRRDIKKEWIAYTKKMGLDLEYRKLDEEKVSALFTYYLSF